MTDLKPDTGSVHVKSEPVSEIDSDVYDFTHRRRGVALIVCNDKFQGQSSREGSEYDVIHFKNTFLKFGFKLEDIRVRRNMTVGDMMDWFLTVSMESHKYNDCLVVAISSHGDEFVYVNQGKEDVAVREDIIYGTDKIVFTRNLVDIFRDKYCPTLAGKPKIFILQACRGTKLDPGVEMDVVDAPIQPEYTISPTPCYKDYCIVYATPPGYFAFRRPSEGSWFVKGLWDVVQNADLAKTDFQKLIVRVFQRVGVYFQSSSENKSIDEKKQSGCMYSMLTKDVYFASQPPENDLDSLISGLQNISSGRETTL